jgi:hypothetical protein
MLPSNLTHRPSGGFVLADRGDHAIRAFTLSGSLAWTFGRKGEGPGEFLAFEDLEFDQDGHLLVLDRDNARLTVLSNDGKQIESLRLPSSMVMRGLLPSFRAGERTFIPRSDEMLWVSVASTGRITAEAPFPSEYAFGSAVVSESYSTMSRGGACLAFRWSSELVLFEADGSVRRVVRGVEPIEFPEIVEIPIDIPGLRGAARKVNPDAPTATVSISSDESRVFVLFSGETEYSGRLVDIYDLRGGDYFGSLLLPHPVSDIAVLAGGELATLEREFLPVVRIWSIDLPREGE